MSSSSLYMFEVYQAGQLVAHDIEARNLLHRLIRPLEASYRQNNRTPNYTVGMLSYKQNIHIDTL